MLGNRLCPGGWLKRGVTAAHFNSKRCCETNCYKLVFFHITGLQRGPCGASPWGRSREWGRGRTDKETLGNQTGVAAGSNDRSETQTTAVAVDFRDFNTDLIYKSQDIKANWNTFHHSLYKIISLTQQTKLMLLYLVSYRLIFETRPPQVVLISLNKKKTSTILSSCFWQ